MSRMLPALFVMLGLLFVIPPAQAQIQQKAYAPENLRSLSRSDQQRVINQEYSDQSRGRRIPDDQLQFYLDQVNRSSWGFSRIQQDIATSLGGGWNPGTGSGSGSGSILCESNDNRRRQCNTGFRGRAAISQNISKTRCIEGQNWGSGNGYVWVDRGCRARFVDDSYDEGGYGTKVRCESIDNRYRECRTNFRSARLTRKLSDSRCTEGETWGQRNGTIWVDRGCRAEFIEGNGDWNPGNGNANYSVTCSSQNNRRTTCAWNSRYGRPYVIQQISSNSCREGTSWGYSGNQVWVDRGCRARFGAR